jgi:hypothetical protein
MTNRISTLQELVPLLENTILADAKVITIDIPESGDRAFAIQINPENGIEAWNLLRSLLDITKCYPVIIEGVEFPPTDYEDRMQNKDLFPRWWYEQEVNGREDKAVDIKSIISRSKTFDVDKCIEDDDDYFWEQFEDEERAEFLMGEITCIKERYGIAPTLDQLQLIVTGDGEHEALNLEKWLFEWEIDHNPLDQVVALTDKIRQGDWFDHFPKHSRHIALLLLPTEYGWETLAYLHWYGSGSITSGGAIAFLKRWYENYQAELICHWGTIIDLKVPKLPQTIQEAFNLAIEHNTFSSYTVSNHGFIREYARELMLRYHWSFHERP